MKKESNYVTFPKIIDFRGNLTSIESNKNINFEIKRVYYLYDVPAGSERGGHAHKELHQILLPLSGSFDVNLSDGGSEETYHLNRPNVGLYICPMTWRSLSNFSSGSVCLVIASNHYDESDYIRDYRRFKHEVQRLT